MVRLSNHEERFNNSWCHQTVEQAILFKEKYFPSDKSEEPQKK